MARSRYVDLLWPKARLSISPMASPAAIPLADRVILWTRVLPGSGQSERIETTWQVAVDAEFTDIVASGVAATDATRDYTVKVDATGLQPDRRYFYRFLADGLSSSIGRTRTLPRGEVAAFRLGVASCSNYPQGYFNAYRHMAESDLDLILHLGDYIYEYPEGGYANPVALQELGRHVQPLGDPESRRLSNALRRIPHGC